MKATADRLIGNAAQGTLEAPSTVTVAGATPLDPPTVTRTWGAFNGAVRGVSSSMVDNVTILASDLQIIAQADADAVVGDMVRIDGVSHIVVRIDNIPAAGTVCAKRIIVRR